MKNNKLIFTQVAILIVITILSGCTKKIEKKPSESSITIDKIQSLNAVLKNDPISLDTSKSTDINATQIMMEVTEGLTRQEIKDGSEINIPAGAKDWNVSEDGLTWTFNLRDYEWEDGKKVTAKDYVYGIIRTLDPKFASQNAYFLYPIKGAQAYNSGRIKVEDVAVKAVDDKTLEIKLQQVTPYFLNITSNKAMWPMRQDIIEKNKDMYGKEANTLISCGPFKITNWTHQSSIELVKNEKYWDAGNVKLDKLTFKIIKEENERMDQLFNGSLDICSVRKPEWIQKYDESKKYDVETGFDGSIVYQFYNTRPEVNGKKNIFSNAKVRQAFTLALNREDVVKTLYKGLGEPAYGWIPFKIGFDNGEYRKLVGEEPIKKLLADNKDPKVLFVAGIKELGMSEDPSKIEITYLSSGTDVQSKEIAEYYQRTFEKTLGLILKIEYMDWPVYQKRTESGNYQIATQAWRADNNDPMQFMDMFLSDAGIVNNGWKNDKYDELINVKSRTTDNKARLAAFKEAEKILTVDDAAATPVLYRKYKVYKFKFVKNVQATYFGQLLEMKYAYTNGKTAK